MNKQETNNVSSLVAMWNKKHNMNKVKEKRSSQNAAAAGKVNTNPFAKV